MKNPKWLLGLALLATTTSLQAQNASLSFDGINDYVDLGNDARFNAAGIKTMEAWVKFNSLAGSQEIISKSTAGQGIEMLVFGGNLAVYCMNSANNTTSFIGYPTSNLKTGIWYHLAFSWDGTKESMRLYVNGASVGTRTDYGGGINAAGVGNPAGGLLLGNWSFASETRYFNGMLDEVRIWSVQRTAAEINAGITGSVAASAPGLTAYYKMNEGSGTALGNSTAYTGLNGTLMNGTAWNVVPDQVVNNGLALDGVDDHVQIGAPLASGSSYTKEAWVYVTKDIAQPQNIVSSNRSPVWIGGGKLHAGNNGSLPEISDPATFPANQWVHVAVTFDEPTKALKMYRNGVLVASATSAYSYVSENNFVGAWFNGTATESYLGGKIEEVRIWNKARTQAEIKAGILASLTGSEANLVRLYSLNQGVDAANNGGVFTVLDRSANAANGALINFALSGTTSNWVASPVQNSENAAYFDGVNDYMIAPHNPQYDFTTGTVEAWVRPDNLTYNAAIVANRQDPNGTRYSFHMSAGAIGLWNNSQYLTVPFTSEAGTWYHIAFVCKPGATDVYVNGSMLGTIPLGVGTTTGKPLYIGYASNGEHFPGAIGEVRIWNVARTKTQIKDDMYKSLTGSEAGLVGLFNFNQGIATGQNNGLVTVMDQTPYANNGTLTNMALSGSVSNYISHVIKPPVVTSFTPASGPAGTMVTITGENFSTTATNNVVYLGDALATVTQATATSLTVTVPQGVTYKPITVTNKEVGLTGFSATPFRLTFAGGPLSFATQFTLAANTGLKNLFLLEGDSDGKTDIGTVSDNGFVSLFRNRSNSGSLQFDAKSDVPALTKTVGVATGDLDGDGRKDVVATDLSVHKISVFRNNGTPGAISLSDRQDIGTPLYPVAAAIGDLNNDGKQDVVVLHGSDQLISVFVNESAVGTISLSEGINIPVGQYVNDVAIADMDGDGKLDLVTSNNQSSSSISVLRNTATSSSISFEAPVTISVGLRPDHLAVGDLDGDNKADIVAANTGDFFISVLRNKSSVGALDFDSRADFGISGAPSAVAIGDVDGDGKADIAATDYLNNQVVVFQNKSTSGTVSLVPAGPFATGTRPMQVVVGDLDGDGKADVATMNEGSNSLSILRNTTTASLLPVTVTSFKAVKKSNSVQLNWSTASESNSSRFEVERSSNGVDFIAIATVKAAGNSNEKINYTSEDKAPVNGVNYYRLKQIDQDGSFEFSPVITANWSTEGKPVVTLAPQPMQQTLTVTVSGISGTASFVVYGVHGALVKTVAVSGNTTFQINRDGLQAGIYIYKLMSPAGKVWATGKLIVR